MAGGRLHLDLRAAALCLLAAVIVNAPHFPFYLNDSIFDIFYHYNWAKEFAQNVAYGATYPKWMFHGRFGLGEPVFTIYAPLYYYAVSLFTAAGASTWAAMHCVEIASNAIFGWFVYRTVSYYAPAGLSLAAGPIAVLNPFLIMVHYKYQGCAWASVGYASHGLLLWAMLRPSAEKRFFNAPAAAAVALAVVGHTISALVNLICFSAAALVTVGGDWRVRLRQIICSSAAWAAAVGVGLALSAFYLVPALYFLRVINSGVWYDLLPLQAFAWPVVTPFVYGMQWFSFQWLTPVPALLLVVLPAAYLFVTRSLRDPTATPILRVLAIAAVAVFFASELSFPLWRLDSPLIKIQLPYRFVSVVYVTGIVASVMALAHAMRATRRRWVQALASGLVLCLALGFAWLVKGGVIDGFKLPAEVLNDEYSFRPLQRIFLDTGFDGRCPPNDEKCFRMSQAGASFRGVPEYQLKWQGPDYLSYARQGFAAECRNHGAECGPTARTADGGVAWSVIAEKNTTLRLPIFHFPSWSVLLDEIPTAHAIDPATGLISIPVPAGRHEVRLTWRLTDIERYSLYLSLFAALLLAGILVWRWVSNRR